MLFYRSCDLLVKVVELGGWGYNLGSLDVGGLIKFLVFLINVFYFLFLS